MSEYVCALADADLAAWDPDVREEIVRCRDCEHARVLHPLNPITGVAAGIEDWRCAYFWNADELCEVAPDGFCAWGERREDR
jgi:hypothetical protein